MRKKSKAAAETRAARAAAARLPDEATATVTTMRIRASSAVLRWPRPGISSRAVAMGATTAVAQSSQGWAARPAAVARSRTSLHRSAVGTDSERGRPGSGGIG